MSTVGKGQSRGWSQPCFWAQVTGTGGRWPLPMSGTTPSDKQMAQVGFPLVQAHCELMAGGKASCYVCQDSLELLLTSLADVLHQGPPYLPLIECCSSVFCHGSQRSLQRWPPERLAELQKSATITQQWAVQEEHSSVLQHELALAQGQ